MSDPNDPQPIPALTPHASLSASDARKIERALADAGAAKLHAVMVQRFSSPRLAAFEESAARADNSPTLVVARYWYSIAVAEALLPALHVLEVTLRNAIFDAVAAKHPDAKGVNLPSCWLDWPEKDSILYRNAGNPRQDDYLKVQNAKRDILRDSRTLDSGRLIAELNFGFWCGLLAGHYGQREGSSEPDKLWPVLLPQVFPDMPVAERSRNTIAERLTHIRKLRNRAFHHEPLWRRRPMRDVDLICETVSWIDPHISQLARAMSGAKKLQETGIAGYASRVRELARNLFP